MKKLFYSLIATLLLVTAAEAEPKISFEPITTTVNIGNVLNFNIVGLGFDSIIDGGGLNLRFNPNVLQVNNVSLNSTIWDFGSGYDVDNTNGYINDMYFMTYRGATGDIPIGTVQFSTIKKGTSYLTLSTSDFSPFATLGEVVPVKMDTGVVSVNDPNAAVPEPATMSLLLAGLGLIGYRKKKD